jgi:hypothetical protein
LVVITLWSTPTTLSNVEGTANSPDILLARLSINKDLLGLYDTTWLALVEDTKHLGPDLELSAMRCRWERLVEFNLSLTVYDTARVELWYTGDWSSSRPRVEIYDFLVGVLEGKDDGVSGEYAKRWMKFLFKIRCC